MKYSIKEIADINRNSLKKEELKKIVYLDTANLTKNKINELVDYDTKTDKVPSRAKRKVEDNDILISTVRPNQEHYGILKNTPDSLIVSTGFAVITPKSDLVDPYYLYAVLTQKKITNYLQVVAENSTSAYPSIKPSVIANLEIDLLTLNKQKSIGKFFKSLEYKIELNNQIISNLEELTSTLFKRWFVDFEFPDENGNPYKSSGGKMVDSELGEIPEGWEINPLSSIAKITSGKRPDVKKTNPDKDNIIPIVGASKIMGYTNQVLENGSIITTGRVGTHGIIQRYREKVWVSDNSFIIKSDTEEFLNQILLRIDYKNLNRGSTQPLITQTDLKKYKIVLPSSKFIEMFESVISKLTECEFQIKKQNLNLEKIRDSLLPKLLSGEIELPEDWGV